MPGRGGNVNVLAAIFFVVYIAIIIILYYQVSFNELDRTLEYWTSVMDGAHAHRTVFLYAGRSFHEEITASIACTLHSMDYFVTVYYDDGVSLAGYHPFESYRKDVSMSFYGRCVDQWVPTSYIKSHPPRRVDALVFITYPMKTGHHTTDPHALQLLKSAQPPIQGSLKVLLVTHHAKENFWKYMPEIEKYVNRTQVAFLFLAEHTYNTAVKIMTTELTTNAAQSTKPDSAPLYNLAYMYPVVPIDMLFKEGHSSYFNSTQRARLTNKRSFAVQGHFGGQHAKRRNITATHSCISKLPRTNTTTSTEYTLSLIGHMVGDIATFTHTDSMSVQKLADLSPEKFYSAVAESNFLVTSLGSGTYVHSQATSTVPTALLSGTPLVSTRAFLQLYPCLREAPVHVQINGATECESLHNAAQLSTSAYAAAKQELITCNQRYFEQSRRTLGELIG